MKRLSKRTWVAVAIVLAIAFSAIGAFASSMLLVTRTDHSLVGIPLVAGISMALTVVLPFLLATVERGVRMTRLIDELAPDDDDSDD